MKIFIFGEGQTLGHSHYATLAIMAPDLDQAITTFADQLMTDDVFGENALRDVADAVKGPDEKREMYQWYADDDVPIEEVRSIFLRGMKALRWVTVDPALDASRVLAYDSGSC